MAKSSPNRLKTLWEKEKLLVTSNFSFSCSVFKRLVLQTRKNQGLFGKGLRNTMDKYSWTLQCTLKSYINAALKIFMTFKSSRIKKNKLKFHVQQLDEFHCWAYILVIDDYSWICWFVCLVWCLILFSTLCNSQHANPCLFWIPFVSFFSKILSTSLTFFTQLNLVKQCSSVTEEWIPSHILGRINLFS